MFKLIKENKTVFKTYIYESDLLEYSFIFEDDLLANTYDLYVRIISKIRNTPVKRFRFGVRERMLDKFIGGLQERVNLKQNINLNDGIYLFDYNVEEMKEIINNKSVIKLVFQQILYKQQLENRRLVEKQILK